LEQTVGKELASSDSDSRVGLNDINSLLFSLCFLFIFPSPSLYIVVVIVVSKKKKKKKSKAPYFV
jgi:hypothetical protein